ncbi:MAG: hypothetical protein P1P64_09195 [Treponemataceae bacterium]
MDRLKELKEARTAAKDVVNRLDNAISSLEKASTWGIFDLFSNGTLSSFIKREKIKEANDNIREISNSLNILNRELKDINMQLPAEISDTMRDNFFDIWFDNIFNDMRVQGEIKDKLSELEDFRTSIINLIGILNSEINTY